METELSGSGIRKLKFAILTCSDSRVKSNDTSGDYLERSVTDAGFSVVARKIVPDNTNSIESFAKSIIDNPQIDVLLTSGGTGITYRDNTVSAISVLFDIEISGFGELFRWISYSEVGSNAMLSNTTAGVANRTIIFVLPGSPSACRTAWEKLIKPQFTGNRKQCGLIDLISRL